MRNNSRKGLKRRSSIITIIIVIAIISCSAIGVINFLENKKEKDEKENKIYVSNLDEEDMMQYEYSKINKDLDGMYALAMVGNNIVGVKSKNEYVNIIQIDSNKEYEYTYYDKSLYLLEKENGIITVVDLNNIGEIKKTISLEESVKSFEIYNDDIYYISGNKLIRYKNNEKEEILTDITSNNFVIKKDYIYIAKSNNLLKIDMDKNETIIDTDVTELYYYNYYERDRLIYDTCSDSENVFKNIYNYYTGNVVKSIRNNTYFVPYDAAKYIYTTSDKKNVILISDSGTNNYLYKAKNKIENINLFKEGYIVLEDVVIDLDTEKEVESKSISDLHSIKYLK